MEKVRQHRDIEFVATAKRSNYLVSEPICQTTKFLFFQRNLIAVEMKKKTPEMFMNKPFHLGLSIQELSKILMYEFWYDYVKPRYGEKVKLCYMDTDSFILYVKYDIYKDIVEDVKTRFDTSNYELYRPLPKGKIKK